MSFCLFQKPFKLNNLISRLNSEMYMLYILITACYFLISSTNQYLAYVLFFVFRRTRKFKKWNYFNIIWLNRRKEGYVAQQKIYLGNHIHRHCMKKNKNEDDKFVGNR